MEREAQEFLNQIHPGDSPLPKDTDVDRWCVQFPNGEPSFYFHPFTKKEYDNVFNHYAFAYADRHPCSATGGGGSLVGRRLCGTLDNSEKILPQEFVAGVVGDTAKLGPCPDWKRVLQNTLKL
ncbi:hypothetical protein PHYPSEUDO_012876 [Phytophthora pseudosyringae]|uniref:Uncharacterized protein n=1 Tax=Phytophthora pseudosyringae TaxID=221518 RepID=A0A8T1V9C8_9STRA|nr:hypothetical protein PHYPSEUDO_012876 [Phytophthora pseudosyringae]